MSVYDAAHAALEAGISIVPILANGTKKPFGAWKGFQATRPTTEQVERWFQDPSPLGLGFVCGAVSGNLEMLEFEQYEVYFAFRERARAAGLGPLIERLDNGYSERSPGGGVHWCYRCPTIAGNTKLAARPKTPAERRDPHDTTRVLIETRGEGGYVIVAPTNGLVHPTGKPYEMLGGGIATIPAVSPEERAALFDLARAFDQMPKATPAAAPGRPARPAGSAPGHRWAAQTSWADILLPHGWQPLDKRDARNPEVTYWCRPGKRDATSASTNFMGSNTLKVFSSSTPFNPEETYSKFGAFALLNHGKDFAAAARALVALGFGDDAHDIEVAFEIPVAPPGAPPPPATAPAPLPNEPLQYPFTDSGNAELLVDAFGKEWRYDHRRALWMSWAGHWWRPDAVLEIRERAKAAARIRFAAAQAHPDDEFRLNAERFARQSENLGRIKNAIELASSMPAVRLDGESWDADPMLLGCLNGVIELPTGRLLPGVPDQYITQHVPVVYDPDATCPRFERFLDEIMSGSAVMRDFLWRAIGYTLTGEVREQKFFACYGVGANGKSSLLNVLQWMLGEHPESGYARALSRTALQETGSAYRSHDDTLSGIVGKRLVTASELSVRQLDTERLKVLTGGDIVTARRMRAEPFDFRPSCKLWLSFNRRPEVRDDTHGFWRRMLVVPFKERFEVDAEPDLEPTLRSELPGILTFAVRGVAEWLERGLCAPASVSAETTRYREDGDHVAQFLSDVVVRVEGSMVPTKRLYVAYQMWSRDQGLTDREMASPNAFGRRMSDTFERGRNSAERYYCDIEIRSNAPADVTK